jgi:hypothetical protein
MKRDHQIRLLLSSLVVLCLLLHGSPRSAEAFNTEGASVLAKHLDFLGGSQPVALKSSHFDRTASSWFALPGDRPFVTRNSGVRDSIGSLQSATINEWNREAGYGRAPPQVS